MASRTSSAEDLLAMVAKDAALQAKVKQDPVAALEGLVRQTESDRWIYRLVVMALGLTGLFVVIGVFTLKALDNTTVIPDALVAIGSAAIAALAALLAPSPGVR